MHFHKKKKRKNMDVVIICMRVAIYVHCERGQLKLHVYTVTSTVQLTESNIILSPDNRLTTHVYISLQRQNKTVGLRLDARDWSRVVKRKVN